ncbi:hypothetical protein ACOSOMT5_P3049 [Acidiphilium sp. MT5]
MHVPIQSILDMIPNKGDASAQPWRCTPGCTIGNRDLFPRLYALLGNREIAFDYE